MVLRASAHNADLGMWFSSRQETCRLTSVGGQLSGLYILPANRQHTFRNTLPKLMASGRVTARKTLHLDAAGEQCDSEDRVKAESAAQMAESAYLQPLSTFVLGTLPRDRMWTNHDPGWHFLLGIDVESCLWSGPLGSQCAETWAGRDS